MSEIEAVDPDDLTHEDDVYEKYKHLLTERELREARQQGRIAFVPTSKGAFYTSKMISDYFTQKVTKQCANGPLNQPDDNGEAKGKQTGSSSSANSGSAKSRDRRTSTVTGMTNELERLGAERLARPI